MSSQTASQCQRTSPEHHSAREPGQNGFRSACEEEPGVRGLADGPYLRFEAPAENRIESNHINSTLMERPHDLVLIAAVFMTCLVIMKAMPYVNRRRRQRQKGVTELACCCLRQEKGFQPSPRPKSLPQVTVGSCGPFLTLRESGRSIRDRILGCFLGASGHPESECSAREETGTPTNTDLELIVGLSPKPIVEAVSEVIKDSPRSPNSTQHHGPDSHPPIGGQDPSPPNASISYSSSGRGDESSLLVLKATKVPKASLTNIGPGPSHNLGPDESIIITCSSVRGKFEARLMLTKMKGKGLDPSLGRCEPRSLASKPLLEYGSKSEIASRNSNPISSSTTLGAQDCSSNGVVCADRQRLFSDANEPLAQGSQKISAANSSAPGGQISPNVSGGLGTLSGSDSPGKSQLASEKNISVPRRPPRVSPPPNRPSPTSDEEFVEISLEETSPPKMSPENKRTSRSGMSRSLSEFWAKVIFNCGQDPTTPKKARASKKARTETLNVGVKTQALGGQEEPWFKIPTLPKISRLDLPWGKVLSDLLFQEIFRLNETSKDEGQAPVEGEDWDGQGVVGVMRPSNISKSPEKVDEAHPEMALAVPGNEGWTGWSSALPLPPFYSRGSFSGHDEEVQPPTSSLVGFSHRIRFPAHHPRHQIPV